MSAIGIITGYVALLAGSETIAKRQFSQGSAVARDREDAVRQATINARTNASDFCRSHGFLRVGEIVEPQIVSQKNIQWFENEVVLKNSCAEAREKKPWTDKMYGGNRMGECEFLTEKSVAAGMGYSVTISIEYFCEK